MQDERAQPSRGPRDDAECHRGHLYTADYEHADSQHDRQTLHHQCTEVCTLCSDLINASNTEGKKFLFNKYLFE
jgi:hypothetical protein